MNNLKDINIDYDEITINKGIEALKIFEKSNDAWVSSRTIAEMFDKRHDNVLQVIDEILKIRDNFGLLNFKLSSYTNSQNKKQPEYLLNRKSFSLIAMGFNGEKALKFKKVYIEAFEAMFNLIQTRLISKTGYNIMRKAIKDYMNDPEFYTYSNEANMINKIVLGMTAKQFKESNNVDETRDNIIELKLEELNKAQILNAQLITANVSFEIRKEIISQNFN